jgi:YHS domain-containing protein
MKQLFTFILFLLSVGFSEAQTVYFNTSGSAIRGYDPVAYFSDHKPVKGSKEFTLSWAGANWQFKSKENLEVFKANPEKYAPQYGGFCAYGVSEDHKSPTDPDAFTIVGDKLYLNYSVKVKELWSKDIKGHIEKAETNWPSLKDKVE